MVRHPQATREHEPRLRSIRGNRTFRRLAAVGLIGVVGVLGGCSGQESGSDTHESTPQSTAPSQAAIQPTNTIDIGNTSTPPTGADARTGEARNDTPSTGRSRVPSHNEIVAFYNETFVRGSEDRRRCLSDTAYTTIFGRSYKTANPIVRYPDGVPTIHVLPIGIADNPENDTTILDMYWDSSKNELIPTDGDDMDILATWGCNFTRPDDIGVQTP